MRNARLPDKKNLGFPKSFFFFHRVNVYILSKIESLLSYYRRVDWKNVNADAGQLFQFDSFTESNWVTLNKKK
ncbi:MAG TPA: hypothetical protein VMI12_13130 [Puia sp.]|nr:hypothetical protein [Puia sp.]